MNQMVGIRFWLAAGCAGFMALAPPALGVGKYALAFWREFGAYENQAPPAGQYGNRSAYVHVWDENGQPLSGKQVYTSWGVLLGATDENGRFELILNPNGYDFQVRDGSHWSDTAPILSTARMPNYGHYSFEVGFMFKQNATNAGVFDTNVLGVINSTGDQPCEDLHAPCTRSLAYYSAYPSNYCSDQYELGNWVASHAQTFVATGNRVIGVKAFMTQGYLAHFYWTVQILEGGPNGTAVGPARSSRNMIDTEYSNIIVKWGVNDVQVVPGKTYCFRVTAPSGCNVYRVNRDNYPNGNYFENDAAVAGSELMGLVLCGTFTNAGPAGTLAGWVRDTNNAPLGGSLVSVGDAARYALSGSDGAYSIPDIAAGTYDVVVSKSGYSSQLRTGIVISGGLTNSTNFFLTLAGTNAGTGMVTNGASILQPFESAPAWSSSFDAAWGSPANFAIVGGGQAGSALQASRSGPGSSARVQVLPLRTNTAYSVSVWIRCPNFSSGYWAECAYKLGNNAASDFDGNSETWTYIKKFDSTANGNGNVWTQYSVNFNSGANTQISVGFKHGASSGTGPTLYWDQLCLASLALPAVVSAVANSPSNVVMQFAEPVMERAATNLANYRLLHGGSVLALSSASFTNETNAVIMTALQAARTNYTLYVNNVINFLQPPTLTGLNGQVAVRAPLTLIPLDATAGWSYEQSGANSGTAWRTTSYDDSAWPSGAPLLGFCENVLPEPIQTWFEVSPSKMTYYFRKRFVLPGTATNAALRLRTMIDDGAVFWLNGSELFRLGMTNNPVSWTNRAARVVGLAAYEGPFDIAPSNLASGTNLLAVEVHQNDPASADVVFGTALEALILPSQIPITNAVLTITREGQSLTLNWTEPMALETATNLLGPWSAVEPATNPATISATNATQFFRLRQ